MGRYMVFARNEYAEPLEFRGEVEAGDDEAASEAALKEHGEEWLEMSLVPVEAVYYAEREESEGAEIEAEVTS